MKNNLTHSRRGMPADAPEVLEILKLLTDKAKHDQLGPDDCIEVEEDASSLVAYYYENGIIPEGESGLLARQLASISISSCTGLSHNGYPVTKIHDFNVFEIGGEKHLLQVSTVMTDKQLFDPEYTTQNPQLSDVCDQAGPATPEEASRIIEMLKSAENAEYLAAA